jgi:hypothetical protein
MTSKKRTINEYRQTKDSVYKHPISHNNTNNKYKDINMNEFMLYLKNHIDTMKRQDVVTEVIASSLMALKNNPELSIYEAVEAGCEVWDL